MASKVRSEVLTTSKLPTSIPTTTTGITINTPTSNSSGITKNATSASASSLTRASAQCRNDEILFIDMDAQRRPTVPPTATSQTSVTIDPTYILRQSDEQSPESVYEIILRAEKISRIENLSSFKKCRSLDLSSNLIQRIENLTGLKDLRELKLYDNDISEISNLDHLSELNFLQLQHNRLRTIGSGLCKLRKLRQLRLDNNLITEINVKQLSSCHALTSVDLSHNQLKDITPLNCLPNLEDLRVACNRLKQVQDLTRCRKLEEIDLSGNKIVDVSGLKGLPVLNSLDLSKNLLASLASTGPLKKLTTLNIADNKFSIVSKLTKQFPNLEILKLNGNRIEDMKELSCLANCEDLVELYVDGNPVFDMAENRLALNSELSSVLRNLEILNGAQIHRKTCRTAAPLMRPMTANTIISLRQVEHQLEAMEGEVSAFEADMSRKFDTVSESLLTLPERGGVERDVVPQTSASPRPLTAARQSRCGSRNKLRDAMAFASCHFDDNA